MKPFLILFLVLALAAGVFLLMQNKEEDPMQAGKDFLAANAKKPGIQTTPSGLQYEVLRDGAGPRPGASSTVEVHYEGRLINGKVFDSSYQRNQTISFPLNRVIPGWTEGLQLMPAGAKYRLYIPSELGYGAAGAGADIPPHSTLIFDVELIAIR